MIRKHQNDLSRLIQSLTPEEKGYFRKYAKRHVLKGNNKTLHLFSAVENQRSFDEKRAALPMLKTHLYDLILDSLRAYHQGSTAQSRVVNLLESCRLLSNKGLYDQSLVVLDKAERLCNEHGLLIDLLTVQHFRVNIFNASSLPAAI
ncbi:MAG TPA: hypothetical protein VI461_08610, partial [Chitinophagaceae bacterium]|nr:hypothetical protein [Chitinophagaceae bacterium]